MKPTLLVLAAGMGSRYGGLKQMDGLGPNGETIIDYSIYDAVQAGFGKVVYIVREYFPNMISITDFLIKGRLVILFVLLILLFTFIYKVIPNRPATWKSQLIGAIGCAMSWYVFAFFLSIAIKYLNGFSLYGSITTLVIIMFWLDISMIIFFVCGEVNNAFEMIMAVIQTERMKKKQADAAKGKGKGVRVERNRVRLQQRAIALERKRNLDEKLKAAQQKETGSAQSAAARRDGVSRSQAAAQKVYTPETPGSNPVPVQPAVQNTADYQTAAPEAALTEEFPPEAGDEASPGKAKSAKAFAASVFGNSGGKGKLPLRRKRR